MELDLETIVAKRVGRTAVVPVQAAFLRPASHEDWLSAGKEMDEGAPAKEQGPLSRITDRHHALARALASGMKQGQAAAVVGMTQSRVSTICGAPMFRELVEFYRSQQDLAFRGVAEKLAGITSDALDELEDRLEDPEKRSEFTTGQLLEIVKTGADRSGFGPSTTQTNVNVTLNMAAKLEERRKKAAAAAMIDITPKEAAE